MRRSVSLLFAGMAALASLGAGCTAVDEAARSPLAQPNRADFELPARVLLYGCGSLDCHGSTLRNFRLFGYGASRLPREGGVHPDYSAPPAYPEELDANYAAIVGLEPELTRQVVEERGAFPERLTLIRKGRGDEQHKGNAPAPAGSDRDRCLVSWLAGSLDKGACERALPPKPPP